MSLRLLAFVLLASAAAFPAHAAQRNFTVTGFERIRVDGPFEVRLTTGVSPFARATGSPAALNGISIEVQGQTLIIRESPNGWGGYPGDRPGPVEIAVGTHELTTAWLNGAGSLAIDKVRGQSFDMTVNGAGSMAVGQLGVDRLNAGVTGSGSAVLGGTAALVTATVRGTATFDGSALAAKDVTIGAEGTTVVKLTATGTAKVDTRGLATVDLAGSPACTVRAAGSAVVNGCRSSKR